MNFQISVTRRSVCMSCSSADEPALKRFYIKTQCLSSTVWPRTTVMGN